MPYTLIIGLFLLFLGMQIIAKTLFNIDLPVCKVFFGLLLIYIGFTVLTH